MIRRACAGSFGRWRVLPSAVAAAWLASSSAGLACDTSQRNANADTESTTNILEEDDFFTPQDTDKHYTHGIRLSFTTADIQCRDAPFTLKVMQPLFPTESAEGINRRYNFLAGQNMYTPNDRSRVPPDRRDRPYAGWLYAGVGMMQDTGGREFEELDLKLGIVGPGSAAKATQTDWHLLVRLTPFYGWDSQLRNQWTFDIHYDRIYRVDLGHVFSDSIAVEALPQWGVRGGMVYDYVAGGGLVRIGRNLGMDYGPPHIDLNTGSDYINPRRSKDHDAGSVGWYLFAGGEARAVGYNVFLDGTPGSVATVAKYPVVGDAELGFAFLWGHFRFSYTYIHRSPEFVHQDGPDHYGTLDLTFHIGL